MRFEDFRVAIGTNKLIFNIVEYAKDHKLVDKNLGTKRDLSCL